ncbi:MAG TPA: cation:proton antiporter [Burkholderiales bacterium]|nr:cation:proton antiporter [Burkholderiales bacterium]
MTELNFLPTLPPAFTPPILFGALLLLGLLGGEAARLFALPRITGYLLVGMLVGPKGLNVLSGEVIKESRVFVDISLGLILFELGRRLDYQWLRRNRWLFATAIAESAFAFLAVYFGLRYFEYPPLFAALAAAIGIATSPAVVLLVAHELRSEGQLTERMLLLTAINSVFAFFSVTMLLPLLHFEEHGGWSKTLLQPLYVLLGSLITGFVASLLVLRFAAWLGKREDRQFIMLVGMIVLTAGLARSLNLSVLVALLTVGILARNLDFGHKLMEVQFGHGGQLFFVILFVMAGVGLRFDALPQAGFVAAMYVVLRFLGKALAILVFGRLSGLRPGAAGLLSIALLPMSGLAIVMVHDISGLYPEFGAKLSAVVLSAVAILELIGPLATQFALKQAGEAGERR